MLLDMHAHSIKSDDGRAKVPNYCQWIRKRELQIEGFVLSEHRQLMPNAPRAGPFINNMGAQECVVASEPCKL